MINNKEEQELINLLKQLPDVKDERSKEEVLQPVIRTKHARKQRQIGWLVSASVFVLAMVPILLIISNLSINNGEHSSENSDGGINMFSENAQEEAAIESGEEEQVSVKEVLLELQAVQAGDSDL